MLFFLFYGIILIEYGRVSMKNSIKYIILVLVFIVFVVSITASNLFTKYSEQGSFNVIRKNFDIVFSNIIVNSDNIKVKTDNTNNSIHIETENLQEEQISIDVKNIANINIFVCYEVLFSIKGISKNIG